MSLSVNKTYCLGRHVWLIICVPKSANTNIVRPKGTASNFFPLLAAVCKVVEEGVGKRSGRVSSIVFLSGIFLVHRFTTGQCKKVNHAKIVRED